MANWSYYDLRNMVIDCGDIKKAYFNVINAEQQLRLSEQYETLRNILAANEIHVPESISGDNYDITLEAQAEDFIWFCLSALGFSAEQAEFEFEKYFVELSGRSVEEKEAIEVQMEADEKWFDSMGDDL